MKEKFDTNPFDRSALTDHKLLAGRTSEFRQIRFILRNSSKQKSRIKSILISGERGVGKTSFLNLIEAECILNNIIPVRINVTETNSENSNEFFWNIFSQTINTVFGLNIMGGKGGPIDAMVQKILNSDGTADPANWVFKTPILRKNYLKNNTSTFEFDSLIEDLRLIRKQVSESGDGRFNEKTKILYLVDESQHVYSNLKIIEDIRFIIQSQDLGIGFVFAGDTSFKSTQWESVFGGSYRDFEIVNLTYFNDVESVIEYFRKSLTAIDWTTNEIEETLFYRFNLACRQIFQLTSGKPAWITTIASKMFERCMNGETKELKFDRQARNEVKKLLEDSGELDRSKLEFIDKLPVKYEKWLSELSACEISTFSHVYFYGKFKLIGDYFLEKNKFQEFCEDLVDRGIIRLIENSKVESSIGFKPKGKEVKFIDKYYYAFDFESDTIKQWLQISSDGKYRFAFEKPGSRFVQSINDELTTEKNNVSIITYSHKLGEGHFRISKIIERINNGQFDVTEESYENVAKLYKACKRLEDSRAKEILYVELKDLSSGKGRSWNIYNYNDTGKIIELRNSPATINKFKLAIEKYKTEDHNFTVEIVIDKIANVSLNSLQKLIILAGDLKMIGIILEAKMEDLVRQYIKEDNIESSYDNACFFYNLFKEGHDLKLSDLNNTAYVFIEKDELDKAISLLLEAKRKIDNGAMEQDELDTATLVFYNLAIIEMKKGDILSALRGFKAAIRFCEERDVSDDLAGVLKILKLNDMNDIIIEEIKEGNKNYPKISCKFFAEENIKVIEKICSRK